MKVFMDNKEYVIRNDFALVIDNKGGVLIMTETSAMDLIHYLKKQKGKDLK